MANKSHSQEYSSSSGSSDEGEEVVWKESNAKSDAKSDANEWHDLFENKSSKSVKSSKKLEEKRQKEDNIRQIRQSRELNPYIRYDKEGNPVVDEPRSQPPVSTSQPQPSSSGPSLSEKNAINAKLLKAQIMGNQSLVKELQKKLKQLESGQSAGPSDSGRDESYRYVSRETKPNEESMSLKEMYYREKQSTTDDEVRRFVATASKSKIRHPDDEYEDTRKKNKKRMHDIERVNYVRQYEDDRQKCRQCMENIEKALVLTVAEKTFICLTSFEPFVKGMCHILSRSHSNVSVLSCDEECLQEINERKQEISRFFAREKRSVVFMETYFKKRHSNRHLMIECIPIKTKYESDAKIFFKKAIMECEGEWAMNKQVIEIKDKPVNRMIPKGLSYFWVTIGPQNNGFAHVIENEESFPDYFGKEVIGGLLDIEPNKWHKPIHQSYDQQFERVIKLKREWKQTFN